MSDGWVKLHRSLLGHPINKHPKYFALFVYFLLMATHEDRDVIFNGEKISIKRGELITGRNKLKELTGLTDKEIRCAIIFLTRHKMLSTRAKVRAKRYTLYRVENYSVYQTIKEAKGQTKDHTKGQTRAKQGPNKGHIQEVKEVKELKKKNNTPLQVRAFAQLWNDAFKDSGVPTVNLNKLSDKRKGKIKSRLKQEPKLDYWKGLFEKLHKLPFYMGDNDNQWTVTLDYMIANEDNHVKIFEKKCKQQSKQQAPSPKKYDPASEMRRD